MVPAIAKIAEKTGYNVTAEDIREALEQEEAIKKAKTDKSVAAMVEMDDADLENVAEGAICDEMDEEDAAGEAISAALKALLEICVFNDECDWLWN